MPAYPQPPAAWMANQFRDNRNMAKGASAGGTEYLIDPTTSRVEAILGNIEHDTEENSTGLSGWGIAVRAGTGWGRVSAAATTAGVATAYRKAAQSIPTGAAFTQVKLDTAINDPEKLFNLAEGSYIAPKTGEYLVTGQTELSVSGKNATSVIQVAGVTKLNANSVEGQSWGIVVCGIVHAEKGQAITLATRQSNAGEVALEISEATNRLSVMPATTIQGPPGKEGPRGEKGEKGSGGGGLPAGGASEEVLLWEASEKGKWGKVGNGGLENEAVNNIKVKKESLEPNRLEKEKLESAQVKLHGLTVDRLKEGELTNAYIKAAAGIEESKLSLTNVVKLTGEQTILGLKTIKAPSNPQLKIYQGEATFTGRQEAIGIAPTTLNLEGSTPAFSIVFANGRLEYKTTPAAAMAALFEVFMTISTGESVTTAGTVAGLVYKPQPECLNNTTGWAFNAVEAAPQLIGLGAHTGTGEANGLTVNLLTATGWTLSNSRGLLMSDATGEGTVTTQVAVQVEDLKKGGTNYSLRSEGAEVKLKHAGPIEATKGIGVWAHAVPAAQPATIKPEAITVKEAMERVDKVLKEYGLTA